jgi:hypothetical protein
MPGMDALIDSSDLRCDGFILAGKNIKTEPRDCRDPLVLRIGDDLEQFSRAIATLGGNKTELAICPRIAFDSIVR